MDDFKPILSRLSVHLLSVEPEPDGTFTLMEMCDQHYSVNLTRVRIFNDAGGATWADADTYVRIGEADELRSLAG